MRHTLMASVAVAALFAATGLAMAQGGAKGAESPAAVSPKADSAAPMNAPAAKGAPDAKHLGDAKVDGKPKAAEGMAPPTTSKDVKNSPSETKSTADSKTTGEMKADGKTKATDSATTKDVKTPTAESKPAAPEGKTTGNAATTAVAAPPAEKRTQITSAIKQVKVEEVTNVNFNVSIGTVVPTSVRYHALPSRIVEIYPEWRGYEFILVNGRYVILRPHTHEIVYIIEG
ncbi:DUF1236 domain-containing protein [Bradyrhizobium sp. LVM 105]|uniref:DUF1236 domain-containing protein n=1 Tax=Bradyrhizobium sp. LVM 105 TaxID=2341115 RepID=UPI000F815CEC|nr:DUF1236 domain-containing protein [Bradyrhizobium sp. LVM 105]RTE91378.1 DUF1236 domain-containing protein [Bradyrhizobium sp. LVM 105]